MVPTTRPRHLITETDQISEALTDAARRWPEDRDSRSKLLLHRLAEGHRAIRQESAERRSIRSAAIARTSGALTGAYEPGYLERLREDWPQ